MQPKYLLVLEWLLALFGNWFKPYILACPVFWNLKIGMAKGGTVIRWFPGNIYLFKINNRNIRGRCEICAKVTIKTPERCEWRRSSVFIVSFEHILHLFLFVDFEQINVCWVIPFSSLCKTFYFQNIYILLILVMIFHDVSNFFFLLLPTHFW